MNDNSEKMVSLADVLRILDQHAEVTWNKKPFLPVDDYAKAIKEIEEL